MLTNPPEVLHIPLRADVFQALVWAMYTDALSGMPEHLVAEVVWAAHYWGVRPAEVWAMQFLRHGLTPTNALARAEMVLAGRSILRVGRFAPPTPTDAETVPEPLQMLLRELSNGLNQMTVSPVVLEDASPEMLVLLGALFVT
jgi:hypothetical protein